MGEVDVDTRIMVFTKNLVEYAPFIERCSQLFKNVRMIYPDDHPRKTEEEYTNFLKRCKKFSPDLIISFYYNRIIQSAILEMPSLAVNFHGSLLPNYAGSHALNWQIINGEKLSGVTIHELTDEVDGGRIIMQESFEIGFEDTARDVLRKGIKCSVELLQQFINDYKSNSITASEQTKSYRDFVCRRRTPEDGEITKGMSHLQAYNLIRALVDPWPGAFYHNEKGDKIVLKEFLTLEEVERLL